jgi:hypothetical protein
MPADVRPLVSSKRIEKNLRTLRKRGLTTRRVDDLDALLNVARQFSCKPTDREKMEDLLARAVNLYEQPSRDGVCLWLGLPATNPDWPVTRDMDSAARTRTAREYWLREVEPSADSTFDTHRVREFYGVLAGRLAKGELAAAEAETTDRLSQVRSTPAVDGPEQSSPVIVHEPIALANIESNDPAVIGIVDELRAASEQGLETAAERHRLRLFGLLAATAASGDRTPLEKLEALLLWGIHETEADRLRRDGLVILFELGPVRPVPWMSERRPLAHRYLHPQSLTGRDRYDWGSEEGAIFTRLARLFTALAIQHRVHAPSA